MPVDRDKQPFPGSLKLNFCPTTEPAKITAGGQIILNPLFLLDQVHQNSKHP